MGDLRNFGWDEPAPEPAKADPPRSTASELVLAVKEGFHEAFGFDYPGGLGVTGRERGIMGALEGLYGPQDAALIVRAALEIDKGKLKGEPLGFEMFTWRWATDRWLTLAKSRRGWETGGPQSSKWHGGRADDSELLLRRRKGEDG